MLNSMLRGTQITSGLVDTDLVRLKKLKDTKSSSLDYYILPSFCTSKPINLFSSCEKDYM